MGGMMSYVWGPSNDPTMDEVDEATGLSGREKLVIRQTWSTVMQDPKTHGVQLFILLFQTNPSAQDYFKSFRGKTLEKIAKSVSLRAHATTVIQSLNTMVESLDDPQCLVEIVHKIGQNHQARGITRNLFDILAQTIVSYLNSQSLLDDFATTSWQKVLDKINDLAEEAMAETQ